MNNLTKLVSTFTVFVLISCNSKNVDKIEASNLVKNGWSTNDSGIKKAKKQLIEISKQIYGAIEKEIENCLCETLPNPDECEFECSGGTGHGTLETGTPSTSFEFPRKVYFRISADGSSVSTVIDGNEADITVQLIVRLLPEHSINFNPSLREPKLSCCEPETFEEGGVDFMSPSYSATLEIELSVTARGQLSTGFIVAGVEGGANITRRYRGEAFTNNASIIFNGMTEVQASSVTTEKMHEIGETLVRSVSGQIVRQMKSDGQYALEWILDDGTVHVADISSQVSKVVSSSNAGLAGNVGAFAARAAIFADSCRKSLPWNWPTPPWVPMCGRF